MKVPYKCRKCGKSSDFDTDEEREPIMELATRFLLNRQETTYVVACPHCGISNKVPVSEMGTGRA